MTIIRIGVAVIGLLTTTAAFAEEDTNSGSYYLQHGCKPDLTKTLSQQEAFEVGWCAGTVNGLLYAADAKTICSPPRVTVMQEVGIVAKYIDDHPDTRHKPFRFLALQALKEAYPCANDQK
jgi:Ssp1 endopeptidase immunity protein Rap1a